MGSLAIWESEFERIGWFIPPYVTMGEMDEILGSKKDNQSEISQVDLEEILSRIYSPVNLANLVIEKYSKTPFVKDYLRIIEDSVEAHFLEMQYAAAATAIPVIEGVARRLAEKRGVSHKYIKETIKNLCLSCKNEVITKELGDVSEVESMIDSFQNFAIRKMYSDSSKYPHVDKTNRNGITHAAYADADYGSPINFYKSIAAINFLCFLVAIDAGLSWFPPRHSESGSQRAMYYLLCKKFAEQRASCS